MIKSKFKIQNSKPLLSTLYLVLSTFLLFSQQQSSTVTNGNAVFYYADGKKSSEGLMRDGKPDGYWKTYHQNEKIKSEGNRKNFVLDSIWKFYNEEGKITFIYTYKEGKKNGLKKTYDPKDEKIITEENYINDIKQGVTNSYYKSGKLNKKINFVDGKEEGIAYEYDEEGTIITLLEYRAGFLKKQEKINRKDKNNWKQGVWKEFYDNGVVKADGRYTDDKKDGYFKEYNAKGSLLNTTKYVNGKLQIDAPELAKVDIHTEYYPDGKIKSTGGYKDGVPEGVHREFSEEGKVTTSKIYQEGVLSAEGIMDEKGNQQGVWKEYHPTGQLKAQGEYKDGKRIGEWVFYHVNGNVEQKGKYDNKGKIQGAWNWYYESGKILREEKYLNNQLDGPMVEYDEAGKVITKGEYIDGLKEGPWTYELGDYREEGSYKSDRREGEWKHFYNNNGKLRFEGKYIDGNPDGKHKYYYPNGNLNIEGKYVMGNKEGDWEYKNEFGANYLTITYENDVEIKFDGVKVKPTAQDLDQEPGGAKKK